MRGKAACRGAATIVNAIPTGRGAAFGITLEADAEVRITDEPDIVHRGQGEGDELIGGCVSAVLGIAGLGGHGAEVRVESDIPVSRGLKSSSAVSNAAVLAALRAAGSTLDDMRILGIAIDESLRAGVTVTGAFDDATACYFGGVVVTDNTQRRILSRGGIDPSLEVVLHVPERRIAKASVKKLDFGPARPMVEEALRHALAGEYAKAMELNSRACSEVLGVSEEVAELARANGAVASGVSGAGPATVVLARREDAPRIRQVIERRADGTVLTASLNVTPAPEVVPRLF